MSTIANEENNLRQEIAAKPSNTMVVIAKRVDYGRDPMKVIDVCGSAEYMREEVVRSMPLRCKKGVVEKVEVIFYCIGRNVSMKESDNEEESLNLTPDPYALAVIIEENRGFVDTYPCYTQWAREDSVASYLAFYRSRGNVYRFFCDRDAIRWDASWWRSGVPK